MLLWLANLGFAGGTATAVSPTPSNRIKAVLFESRTHVISNEDRTEAIPSESRIDSID